MQRNVLKLALPSYFEVPGCAGLVCMRLIFEMLTESQWKSSVFDNQLLRRTCRSGPVRPAASPEPRTRSFRLRAVTQRGHTAAPCRSWVRTDRSALISVILSPREHRAESADSLIICYSSSVKAARRKTLKSDAFVPPFNYFTAQICGDVRVSTVSRIRS